MNREFILKKLKPYLNNEGNLGEEDFESLFGKYSKRLQYEIINILIEEDIDLDYENTKIDNKKVVNIYDTRVNKQNLYELSNESLCVIYQRGNKLALDYLVEKNSKLIWRRVKKYSKIYNHNLDDEDLYQYGVMGLMKAIEKFQEDKEAKLTTYAVWWIDQSILRSIVDYGFIVRVPVHLFGQVIKLNKIIGEHLELITDDELYNALLLEDGMSKGKIDELMNIRENILTTSSLNSLIGEDKDSERVDFLFDNQQPTIEDKVIEKDLCNILRKALGTLKEREERILRLRYGFDDSIPMTLEAIAKEYNLSRERIRQIETKALRKLNHPSRLKQLRNFIEE